MIKQRKLYSFIIPALNEEINIKNLLNSISIAMKGKDYEMIVCDNGSKDSTRDISKKLHASVILDEKATIGGLRNIGARAANGEVLIFLDADITLDENWANSLENAMKNWPEDCLIVTGNTYLIPEKPSFIEKNWFDKLGKTTTNYINSGHLITTRKLFNRISGFNATLKTAEDYDFCQRAKSNGAIIKEQSDLKAYHHGFPKTLLSFMIREAWHGTEDFSSMQKYLKSKTAILATINGVLLLSALVLIINGNINYSLYSIVTLIILSLIISRIKFGTQGLISSLKTACCCELYLIGRILSPFFKQKRPKARTKNTERMT